MKILLVNLYVQIANLLAGDDRQETDLSESEKKAINQLKEIQKDIAEAFSIKVLATKKFKEYLVNPDDVANLSVPKDGVASRSYKMHCNAIELLPSSGLVTKGWMFGGVKSSPLNEKIKTLLTNVLAYEQGLVTAKAESEKTTKEAKLAEESESAKKEMEAKLTDLSAKFAEQFNGLSKMVDAKTQQLNDASQKLEEKNNEVAAVKAVVAEKEQVIKKKDSELQQVTAKVELVTAQVQEKVEELGRKDTKLVEVTAKAEETEKVLGETLEAVKKKDELLAQTSSQLIMFREKTDRELEDFGAAVKEEFGVTIKSGSGVSLRDIFLALRAELKKELKADLKKELEPLGADYFRVEYADQKEMLTAKNNQPTKYYLNKVAGFLSPVAYAVLVELLTFYNAWQKIKTDAPTLNSGELFQKPTAETFEVAYQLMFAILMNCDKSWEALVPLLIDICNASESEIPKFKEINQFFSTVEERVKLGLKKKKLEETWDDRPVFKDEKGKFVYDDNHNLRLHVRADGNGTFQNAMKTFVNECEVAPSLPIGKSKDAQKFREQFMNRLKDLVSMQSSAPNPYMS